jgi:hypothetical protein
MAAESVCSIDSCQNLRSARECLTARVIEVVIVMIVAQQHGIDLP